MVASLQNATIKPELKTFCHKTNKEPDPTKQTDPNSPQPMDQQAKIWTSTVHKSQTVQRRPQIRKLKSTATNTEPHVKNDQQQQNQGYDQHQINTREIWTNVSQPNRGKHQISRSMEKHQSRRVPDHLRTIQHKPFQPKP